MNAYLVRLALLQGKGAVPNAEYFIVNLARIKVGASAYAALLLGALLGWDGSFLFDCCAGLRVTETNRPAQPMAILEHILRNCTLIQRILMS